MMFNEKLVLLEELDGLCQGTFKGYKSLNRMQSLVYPVAYQTNENMLVCAPTGAGKTDVAMLTALHTISQHTTLTNVDDETIQYDVNYSDFKIIYVAPLKALAAEIVEKFAKKLAWLGISVRELTGDMQLTKAEILTTQMIVTTPEKWDVVTRKANGDNELIQKVKLLIIDEVHLLHEERGSVIETLVARTLRQVESSQSMIRVIGLSATLPNYVDVADFLGVNRMVGMFYFDQSFRPVPLEQHFIGVKGKAGSRQAQENIDKVAYDKLILNLKNDKQVMIFVHSRKETSKTGRTFINFARNHHDQDVFDCSDSSSYIKYKREMATKSRNKDMRDLFDGGFGVHHAGMTRSDRNLTEKMFLSGAIKVLCCTATLAWGVNLPAGVVIIKGTQVYNAKQGGFVDLGISDVIQIFGRAGRPQFEKFGTGIICTTNDRLSHYVSLITQQHPIESRFSAKLVDNLNAEISLGTVTNVEEAIQWLGYTYMYVRMRENPFKYGIDRSELVDDPTLGQKRRNMIIEAARRLHLLQMIIFDERSGIFIAKDNGRVASDFYLLNNSIEIFNSVLNPRATEADILSMISMSGEFDNIKARPEETKELESLLEEYSPCQIAGGIDTPQGKTNVLLQAYISKANVQDSALISDRNYVAQNAVRIVRALFLISMNRRWGILSKVLLSICKAVEKQLWSGYEHPLRQFDNISEQIFKVLESKDSNIAKLRDMEPGELGQFVHNTKMGKTLARAIDRFPWLIINAEVFPITKNVLRIHVEIEPDFIWDDRYHGKAQYFWVWVEDSESSIILHVEKFILSKRQFNGDHVLDFMIPLTDPLPPQVIIRAISDTWVESESVHAISFQHLIRPENEVIQTKLLRLQPLPITALHNPDVEEIYRPKFRYFNPMQTMVFHTLYNTNGNVFVGSPTGSGKTLVAELAIWRAYREYPNSKVVYIAPMKALVRERVDDWSQRIMKPVGKKLVELTGDSTPDARDVKNADLIITTPEKFDGISRNWKTRKFVQEVSLVIMDEIHLLASDRGPILEMIVSRMNYMSSKLKHPVRLLGLSTAVSNAADMSGWLGVKEGLFNFPQSVRPVPLQMYIDGFQDNLAFCPLMKTMNKPAFMAIKTHSPSKPVLIFVASRRQTRLTAIDLINLCGMEENPRRFLKMNEDELHSILAKVKDDTLKLSLQFGIGLHHAGLVDSDRRISHELFASSKIQILVATSTLAWGVNLPAYLVIIKGTQFFDAKTEAYKDMDLTDILQMMGRAGRPAFDTSGIAIIYTKESKKTFYKHFLNIGFPVESSLHKVMSDHLGAEIQSGTIKSKQEAIEFLSWTFLFRRVHNNPSYYGINEIRGDDDDDDEEESSKYSNEAINKYLSGLIQSSIEELKKSSCIEYLGDENLISPTPFLKISSYYYLSHKTIRNLLSKINRNANFKECLTWLCEATEYDELPVRHNEDLINIEMSKEMRYQGEELGVVMWDPHVKSFLLLQAFMSRVELPITDYIQDTVSVLDQSLRILQASVDVSTELGYLSTTLTFIKLIRCIKQACWFDDDPVSTLPGLKLRELPKSEEQDHETNSEEKDNKGKNKEQFTTIGDLGHMNLKQLEKIATKLGVKNSFKKEFLNVTSKLPTGNLKIHNDDDNLHVKITHNNPGSLGKDFKMYCPKFPKTQKESWFIILYDESKDELLLLKRSSPPQFRSHGGDNRIASVETTIKLPEALKGRNMEIKIINDAIDIEYSTKFVYN